MPVKPQEGQQSANQRRRKYRRVGPVHRHGGNGEKQHHGDGHRGTQAVDTVGQVHGIDTAHNDEHTEDPVNDRRDKVPLIEEGNIQVAGENAAHIQHVQKYGGNRSLEHSLLEGGQAHIPAVMDLVVVVNKADEAEAGSQGKDKERAILLDPVQVGNDAHQTAADKHQTHHQGRSRLAVVPGRTDVPDGLASLQGPEHRQQQITKQGGHQGTGNCRDNHTNH